MQLKNQKLKPITVIYQGKKIVVYPGHSIDGPIQLSIFGLTPIENKITTSSSFQVDASVDTVSAKQNIKINNDKEIDKCIEYVKSYKKNELPSVAICILTKNSYELISECINSIEKHVKYPNTSIYIFDTGTTDEKTISFYNSKVALCKIPVKYLSVGEYHFSKNYNYGLKNINADYYLIQNNDTLAINDYVSKLMQLAIINKVGACGPRMLYKDGLIQHDGQFLYDHQKKTFCNPGHINLKRNTSDTISGIQPADGITCAGMLIRSSVFWEAGGLNEKYHDLFQDVELNIKLRMNGHAIYCDRDSLIHHYDNTSRNKFWANDINKLKLKHLDYNYLYGKYAGELKYFERKKKKFSIITVVNDETQYVDFLNDLKNQDCDVDFEVIPLPNFNNEYTGCSTALNLGMSIAEGEYIIMCHQDLRVPSNWINDIYESIRNFIINDINFGVLGMAGSWTRANDSDGVIFLTGTTSSEKFKEVQCLDELCLIIKNGNNIKFDSVNFPHYHCYGSDLCLAYINGGYRNFAINCPCTHLSDGFKNLTNIDHLNMYLKNTLVLFKKWRNTIPEFRNMTARFSRIQNAITFYIADELENRGIHMTKHVVLPD